MEKTNQSQTPGEKAQPKEQSNVNHQKGMFFVGLALPLFTLPYLLFKRVIMFDGDIMGLWFSAWSLGLGLVLVNRACSYFFQEKED